MWKSLQNLIKVPEKKSFNPRPSMVSGVSSRPLWAPRNYQSLIQEGYMSNVIVYRCVSLISRGIASVPWCLFQGDKPLSHHPLLDLIHHPNPRQSGAGWMESVVGYLLLSGNSYLEYICDTDGNPCEIYNLRPDRIRLIPGDQGIPRSYVYHTGSQERHISVDPISGHSSLLHLRLFHPLHDWYGLSPIEVAARSIDQHNAVGDHNLSLLKNGGRPTGALFFNRQNQCPPLTLEQREELREGLKNLCEGRDQTGRVLLLEGDFEWKEMGLNPKDMDFLDGRAGSARDVAQAFGVPPMLVGVPGDATFSNYKEARFHLWEDTILPLLDHIVDGLNSWIVKEFQGDLRLGYHIEGIPALAQKQEDVWSRINQATFLTINEKRALLGYGPLPGSSQEGGQLHG